MFKSSTALAGNSNTEYKNRLFVYEVVGLSQNGKTSNLSYPIRRSGSIYLTVPYSRMNQEMQRISRLGGQIVNITPVSNGNAAVQVNGSSSSEQQQKKQKSSKSMTQAKAQQAKVPVNIYRPNSPEVG